MEEQEKMYWAAVQAGLPEATRRIVQQLISYYGSIAAFWHARDTVPVSSLTNQMREKLIRLRSAIRPEKLWEDCRRKKVKTIACIEETYPQELLFFPDSPVILYYYGETALLRRSSAGVVGSRRCTAYGQKVAFDFSRVLAEAGFCIVSGMAKGIDAAAHEGALSTKAGTIAVLGCGVDIPYPPDNRKLYWRIREEGLVLSEFFPGEKPLQWHFPLRNRIISGLSRFILLVEGQARSGALITCNWAAEQGKDVWAVPGPVTNPYSIGPLLLIRDGAMMAITAQDILGAYRPENGRNRLKQAKPAPGSDQKGQPAGAVQLRLPVTDEPSRGALSPEERTLYESISYYPVHINNLLARYDAQSDKHVKTEGKLYLGLTKLLSLRLIEKLPGEYYQRI
ncbi:MAG: DNA-processing protein DprA [Clostridiales bacterium]|nr:DNA-processing protein DprA [Clostridiales bacterium]